MKLSIIIPNYNGRKYIRTCIDALCNQTINFYEIIVVDNASHDESCNYIEKRYPNVRLIKLKKNYGFSRAVNEGIKASKGDFVVLLNNDTEVKKNWLENLLNCIEKDEKIFSCCSKMIRYNEKGKIDDAGDEYSILGWAYKCGDGANLDKYNRDKEVFSSCAGAAIYRRKVFDKIGYFDENFFAYMEDVDISYRAKLYGYKNMYCSKAKVYHVGSGTTGSKYNKFKVRLAARNNIYVVYKNMPIVQFIFNFPFLLLGCIIKLFFFCNKGFLKEYVQGMREALNTLNKINKINYSNRNFINYFKIELYLIVNTVKYIFYRVLRN